MGFFSKYTSSCRAFVTQFALQLKLLKKVHLSFILHLQHGKFYLKRRRNFGADWSWRMKEFGASLYFWHSFFTFRAKYAKISPLMLYCNCMKNCLMHLYGRISLLTKLTSNKNFVFHKIFVTFHRISSRSTTFKEGESFSKWFLSKSVFYLKSQSWKYCLYLKSYGTLHLTKKLVFLKIFENLVHKIKLPSPNKRQKKLAKNT